MQTDSDIHWYALRAFKRKVFRIKEFFEAEGWKTYMAMRSEQTELNGHLQYKDVQIVPNLLFVCCTEKALEDYKKLNDKDFMVYRHKVQKENGDIELKYAPIPESQMKLFIFITSTGGGKDIEYYSDVMPEFSEGQRVRVVDGIYKGAEGIVKRIKRDRKLLVAVEGIAVVAISKIPMSYLQKI